MSINEKEFVDIRQDFVHDELNIKVEDCSGDEEDPGDEFSASESKCGDIFHCANGLFVFCCYYCSEKFAAIEEFVSHFEEIHAKLLISKESNESSLNLREVEETNESLEAELSENIPWSTVKIEEELDSGNNLIKIEENLGPENSVPKDLLNEDEPHVENAPKVYSETEIQCPKCPYTFRWKNLLVDHLRRIHKDHSGSLAKLAIENQKPGVKIGKSLESVSKIGPAVKLNSSFLCRFCGKIFKHRTHFRDHEFSHTGEKPHKCCHCSLTFGFQRLLSQHLRNDHQDFTHSSRNFIRKLSSSLFEANRVSSDSELELPGLVGDQNEAVVSVVETEPLKNNTELSEDTGSYQFEENKVEQDQDGKETCVNSSEISEINKDISDTDGPSVDPLKPCRCPHCPKSFRLRNHLSRHLLSHNHPGPPFMCRHCSLGFPLKVGLLQHLRKVHDDVTGSTKAAIIRYQMMKSHKMVSGRPNIEKQFKCRLCPKRFTTPQTMKDHERFHILEMPYKCAHCPNLFYRNRMLQEHLRHVHNVESNSKIIETSMRNPFSFNCRFCDKSCSTIKERVDHETSHSVGDRYQCPTCLKTFRSRHYFYQHTFQHFNKQSLQCEECGINFTTPGTLLSHKFYIHRQTKTSADAARNSSIA